MKEEARRMYKLAVPQDVRGLIRTMHPSLKKKVKASLEIILSKPSSGKALRDELSGLKSFRVSSLRVIYRIKDPKKIGLVAIGPRGRIYEETFRMIQKEEGKYRRSLMEKLALTSRRSLPLE